MEDNQNQATAPVEQEPLEKQQQSDPPPSPAEPLGQAQETRNAGAEEVLSMCAELERIAAFLPHPGHLDSAENAISLSKIAKRLRDMVADA